MKSIITLTAVLFLMQVNLHAQDKDLVARTHYNSAEEYYTSDTKKGYQLCIWELDKAEEALGATNPKIMELKTRAWIKLTDLNKSITSIYVVDTCMQKFFALADPKTYPEERYMEMIRLKNNLQTYKESLSKDFEPLYREDNTQYGDVYALYYLNTRRMKPCVTLPFVSPSEEISADKIKSDTLYSLFQKGGKNYYALPIKTGDRDGYLFWFYSSEKLGSWYMAYKDKDQQKKAMENDGTGFFSSFYPNNAINLHSKFKKNEKWPILIIQSSAIKLHANTEYFIWFTSSEDESAEATRAVQVFYSAFLTDDADKTVKDFQENNTKKKLLRLRGLSNHEY